jgi:hypothetical protein
LSNLSWISNKVHRELLKEEGWTTSTLATAGEKQLLALRGIGKVTAKKLIFEARKLIVAPPGSKITDTPPLTEGLRCVWMTTLVTPEIGIVEGEAVNFRQTYRFDPGQIRLVGTGENMVHPEDADYLLRMKSQQGGCCAQPLIHYPLFEAYHVSDNSP